MRGCRPQIGASCAICPLVSVGKPVYDREGSGEELIVIGDAPSRDDVKASLCFSGNAGKLMDTLFRALDQPRPYMTSAVRCGLPGGAKPSKRDMALASRYCKELTDALIAEIQPKCVLSLGALALDHLIGLKGVENYRGCCWDVGGYVATCSIHPGGLLQKDEKRIWIELLRDDVAKAFAIAAGKRSLWLPDVGDAADVAELLSFLKQCHRYGEMGVDVETTGLDALTCSLRTIGVGNAEKGYSIPWPAYYHSYWKPENWRKVYAALRKIFSDPKMHLVFSNKIYDVPVLRQSRYFGDGIKAVCDDILLKHHAVYPKLPHDLQSMSSQFLAVPPWKSEFKDSFGEWDEIQDKTDAEVAGALYWYNACDVVSTMAVDAALSPLVISHEVEAVYSCDNRMVDVAIDWYRRGILIDIKEVRRLATLYRSGDDANPGVVDKLEALVQGYAADAGMADFNPASPPQLAELLFKRLQLPATALTETGKISTAKEQLFKIFHKHPIIPALMKLRKESHLYSTYLIGLEKKLHHTGRLHSVGNITSTPSGRFGFKPAVQNWPKGKKEGEINMLTMMIASPGCRYIVADFNALELRFFALLAGERRLIEYFNDDADVHSIHAEAFFGEAFRRADVDGKKLLRSRGKPVTFGKNYGAGADALFEQILPDRLDEDPKEVFREVQHMSNVYDGLYPMLMAAGDYFVHLATTTRNLRTMLTRRLRKFPMGGVSLTVAKNHPVQGGAGDVANLATLRWVDELKASGAYWKTVWPTLQIHDSLAAEVAIGHEEEEAERLKRCLYDEITFTSPVSGSTNTMKFPVVVSIADTAAG